MLWITGANGLLGSALKSLSQKALSTGREVDIANLSSLRALAQKHPGITHIVNCAAFSLVDAAEVRREEAFQANAIGPAHLALIAREMGAKLIHLSTDYIFAGDSRKPLREEDPASPCNFYGQTKLEGEQRALALGASVIRTSWIFGPKGKTFVNQLLTLLQSQKEIRVAHDQWSRFTYASDLAKAILQMLDRPGLYHYANTGVATKYEFALALREEALRLNYPIKTEAILPVPSTFFSSSCKRPVYSAFDTTKIETHLSIRPWKEALREFLCDPIPACL